MVYDLDQEDIEERCSAAGVDLTNVAEKELKWESESDATGATFPGANMDGCLMYRNETTCTCVDRAVLSESRDIFGVRVIVRTGGRVFGR